MGKLFTAFKRLPRRTSALAAIILAAVVLPAALFAWGPDRPTYTIEQPADHVTFNSITNNPNIGDERNFVGIREAGTTNLWKDDMNVERGKEYTVRMYVHNNAAANLNKVAENVTARFTLPTTTGRSVQVDGAINSTNASPAMVYDHATFKGGEDFNVAYVPGTLKFENNSFGAAGTALPESIFDQRGALLGYSKLDGKIPGCFEFAGYVTFKVKPQFAPKNEFEMTKQVRKTGETAWQKTVATKPGDTVEYQVSYKNTGETRQNNVVAKDTLPAGLTYVDGSTYLKNGTNPSAIKVSDNLTKSTGINVGDYNPAAAAYVKFSAKVNANDALPTCGPNKLTNKAQVIVDGGYKEDTADVTVPKECQPEAKYICENLTVDKIERTKFKFTTATSEQNATFKKVVYVIRNEQGTEVDRKESTAKTLDYTREMTGKYTVEALTTFTVNGADKTVTSSDCKKPFEVTELPPTPKYTCDSLTVTKIDRTNFKFDTKYTVENATFKNVTYVIRNESGTEIARTSNPSYTQDKVGKYTVEAIVTVTVNGQDKTVSGENCKKPFEVTEVPPTPAYTCDALTASRINRAEYSFTGKATATGGATITNYTFDFGDSTTPQTVTNPTDVKHTYAKDGTYTATLSVTVKVGGTDKVVTDATKCVAKVTISPEECKPGVPMGDERCTEKPECKPGIPMDDERCKETPMCKPGIPMNDERCNEKPSTECKPGVPMGDAQCNETPAPIPAELPRTGAGDGLVALIGAGSLIAAIGYYGASRRALGQ